MGRPCIGGPYSDSLSIIIVSYNVGEFLVRCLRSIQSQITSFPVEVIVVDNASSDGVPEMVQRKFPWVILVQNSENVGYARACNQGIDRASSSFVLLLNNDTELLPGFLEKLLNFASRRPRAAIIGCRHVDECGNSVPCFAHGFLLLRPRVVSDAGRLRHGWVSGACMLLRREAYIKCGTLDEQFFFGYEDMEICWRMLKLGWFVYVFSGAVVHYRSRSTGNAFNPVVYVESRRGLVLAVRKHGHFLLRLVAPWWVSSGIVFDLIVALLKGNWALLPVYVQGIKKCLDV